MEKQIMEECNINDKDLAKVLINICIYYKIYNIQNIVTVINKLAIF